MALCFNNNWKRLIISFFVAVLLVFNGISVAQAGADNQIGDAGQFDHCLEVIKLSHAGETHGNNNNQFKHSNTYVCQQVSCHFFMLFDNPHRRNLSVAGLTFRNSPDQLTGIFNTLLERPPKPIL